MTAREVGAAGQVSALHNEMMIIAGGGRRVRAMSDGNNFQFQFNFYVARMELTSQGRGGAREEGVQLVDAGGDVKFI